MTTIIEYPLMTKSNRKNEVKEQVSDDLIRKISFMLGTIPKRKHTLRLRVDSGYVEAHIDSRGRISQVTRKPNA